MKGINRDTDYAARALLCMAKLARENGEAVVSVDRIVKIEGLPRVFLRRLLQLLINCCRDQAHADPHNKSPKSLHCSPPRTQARYFKPILSLIPRIVKINIQYPIPNIQYPTSRTQNSDCKSSLTTAAFWCWVIKLVNNLGLPPHLSAHGELPGPWPASHLRRGRSSPQRSTPHALRSRPPACLSGPAPLSGR